MKIKYSYRANLLLFCSIAHSGRGKLHFAYQHYTKYKVIYMSCLGGSKKQHILLIALDQ